MRTYFVLLSAVIRSQLQYRTSFVLETLGTALFSGLEFAAFLLAFTSFGSIGGWSLWQVAFLWGLSESAFAVMDLVFSGYDPGHFSDSIKLGTFDQFLLRPVNLVVQVFSSSFALRRLGRLAQGLLIFGLAVSHVGIVWSWDKLVYLPLVFVGAVAFYGALFTIGATLCFWTTESIEIINVFTYGGTTMVSYPMHIYQDFMRRIFTFIVPTALIIYYPALFFFDIPDPTGLPKLAQYLSPLVGVGALVLAQAAWHAGLRRYQSTGS
jgi:ABC-2 type transport system permease protein